MKLFSLFGKDTPGDGSGLEPSEARLRTLMITLAMILGPLLLLLVFYQATFSGLTDPNAMDFAQIGRNIQEGRNITTNFLRPLVLVPGASLHRQPDVMHGPLYPFTLALAFGAFGANDTVVAWVSGFFFLLTLPVLYLLCLRVFRREVAVITTLIFACSGAVLNYAVSGLHVTLYTFLTTWLLLTIYDLAAYARANAQDPGARLPRGKLALAGVLAALLYLTDTIFFFTLPVVAVAAIWLNPPRQRTKAAAWVLVPLILLILPWLIRNWTLAGNPFFGPRVIELWMGTPKYSSDAGYRLSYSDFVPGKDVFTAVVQKLLVKFGRYLQLGFSQFAASWVLIFFVPGLFFRFNNPATNLLRKVLLWILLATLLGTVLFDIAVPLYIAVMPVMLAFAVAYLLYLMQQAQLSRSGMRLAMGLLAATVLYPLLGGLFLAQKSPEPAEVRSARSLAKRVGRKEIVLSDQPYLVAWYANRPSLWLPAQDQRLQKLRDHHESEIRWLFLTKMVDRFDPDWNTPEWQEVYQSLEGLNQKWKAQYLSDGKEPAQPHVIVKEDPMHPITAPLAGFEWVVPSNLRANLKSGPDDTSVVMANVPAQAAAVVPNASPNASPDPQEGLTAPTDGNTASSVPVH